MPQHEVKFTAASSCVCKHIEITIRAWGFLYRICVGIACATLV